MAVIDKPSDYFNTKLWTGNGSDDRSITGVGFKPDWVWLKQRNGTNYHTSFDSVRGATKRLFPNVTEVQDTNADSLQAFETDGFEVGTNGGINGNSSTYVAWNWLAGTTSGIATNGATTITPQSYSFNQTSGMSIINYDGNNTAGAKVPHGLGATPDMMIVKAMNGGSIHWAIYHKDMGNTHYMQFDTNAQLDDAGVWNDTSPDSVNFTVGNSDKTNTVTYIAYCFKDVPNYSKFGSYVGNGDSSGAFIYTGFKPAFIIFKRSIGGTGNWQLLDNKRLGFNNENRTLYPNSAIAEEQEDDLDIVSNGFKLRNTGTDGNGNGSTYIYMAFAENPFVTSTGNGSIPATAR